jgi:hypothetical protein
MDDEHTKHMTPAQRRRYEKHVRKDLKQVEPPKDDTQDLVWDAENPPVVNSCTMNDGEHVKDCDGNCEQIKLDELDVMLVNERRAWVRAGMLPLAFPLGVGNMPGLRTDLLDLEVRVVVLTRLLVESKIIDGDALNQLFKEVFHDRLHSIRVNSEEEIRRQRAMQTLSIAQKTLLDANGRPLH